MKPGYFREYLRKLGYPEEIIWKLLDLAGLTSNDDLFEYNMEEITGIAKDTSAQETLDWFTKKWGSS